MKYTFARLVSLACIAICLSFASPLSAADLVYERTSGIGHGKKRGGPFFLYLPLCPPHTPIVPAAEFVGQSGVDQYGDWLYQGDWILGQVLDALDRNGVAENTLVIATSDNGAAGRAYAPLRASKSSIYEGGHRAPFLARWPGKWSPVRSAMTPSA